MGHHRQSLLGKLKHAGDEVLVIGGGVSGLLAAHYARRAGWDVTVHEASHRPGGLIRTVQTPFGMAEAAAHSFLMTPAFAALFADLSLSADLLRPRHRARFIYRNGRMKRMPLKATELLRLMKGLARVPIEAAMTVAEFGQEVLGPAGGNYLLEPAMAGIFAGDPQRLDLAAVLPFFEGAEGHTVLSWRKASRALGRKAQLPQELEILGGAPQPAAATSSTPGVKRRPRSLRGMFVLRGGTEQLISALAEGLGAALRLSAPVNDLGPALAEGKNIILATDAATTSKLLAPHLPAHLGARLAAVEYVPLLTATVFVKRGRLARFKEGVGVLFARDQGVRALGVLFNSSAFAGRVAPGHEELVSFTIMYGGATDRGALAENDSRVKTWITEDLSTLFGLVGEGTQILEHVEITRWPRALLHYTGDLRALWPDLAAALPPGVAVFGNWTGQVSLRGMVESLNQRFPVLMNQ